ncbi:hypothetical protein [Streptomyces sp. YGL11-2]
MVVGQARDETMDCRFTAIIETLIHRDAIDGGPEATSRFDMRMKENL